MKSITRRFVQSLGYLMFVGFSVTRCGGGTDAGNPATTVQISVVGLNGSTETGLTLSSGIQISEARLVLGRIRLRPFSNCSQSGSSASDFDLRGPFVTDLLASRTLPSLPSFTSNETKFCRFELKMEKLNSSDRPEGVSASDELIDRSLIVKGTRADSTPFSAFLDIDEDFKIENLSGFSIDSNKTLFMAFNLDSWFSNVSLDSATISSGTILIDKSHNSSLLDLLVRNVKTSSKLFEDKNGDNRLNENEANDDDAKAIGSE